jgi:hypothetical protein
VSATSRFVTYHGKNEPLDETAYDLDMETGGSHHTSTRTSNRNASRTQLYKRAYIDLNDDLRAESEHKPTAQREEQREGESLCADTSMVAGHSKEGPGMSDGEILKIRVTLPSFKKMPLF